MVKVAPSILSADFAQLGNEVRDIEQGGADWVHVDVMDGHFVPNITIGPLIVEAIRPHTTLPLDVHLMIESPDRYLSAFAQSGADLLSVHQEACPHLHRTVYKIKEYGVKAGVVLNPATPVEMIKEILPDLDLILFMSVNPGFGGQSFIPSVVEKIRTCKRWIEEKQLSGIEIEVDGGINPETAKACIDAGATVLVAGSAIFNQKDRAKAIRDIRQ